MKIGQWIVVSVLTYFSGCLMAADVAVVGLFGDKAVLVIDGAAPRTLSVGESANGVKLLSVDKDSVQVEMSGKRDRISIGQQSVSIGSQRGSAQEVTLISDIRGQFSVQGSINGAPASFMVDTGASHVAMSPSTAVRAGIDYRKGQMGMASTANGISPMWRVRISRVTIGDLTLLDVDGLVTQQEMPQVLLGMSFLNRMEMLRQGNTMVLRQRY